MPRTYLDITSSTASVHSYSTLNLLDQPSLGQSYVNDIANHDTDEDQFRLFKNGTELIRPGLASAAYSVNETTKDITLTSALISSDRLLIVRQTRRDQPYVTFTNSARLKKTDDVELFLNQVLYIVQELNEEEEIQTILNGLSYPDAADRSGYNATTTGSTSTGPFSYAAISLIDDNRVEHVDQLSVIKNGASLTIIDDYTISVSNEEITLEDVLIVTDNLEIRRQTSLDRYVPSIPSGSSHSSDIVGLQFEQIENLIQELPHQLGLDVASIRLYRNPRRKTYITYSGPGDRFYYGNLPWFSDGTIFVWKDNVLLTETTDYYEDDWQWIIDLINQLLSSENIVISVEPRCPFPVLFCNGPGDWGDIDPDNPLGPDDEDGVPSDPSRATVTVEKAPSADTQLRQAFPTTFDDDRVTVVLFKVTGSNSAVFPMFEFDLSSVDISSLSSVKLKMTSTSDSSIFSITTQLRRILRTVVIPEASWNEFSDGNSWGTGGALLAGTDYDAPSAVVWVTGTVDIGTVIISPDIKALATAAKADDGILRLAWWVDPVSPAFSVSYNSVDAVIAEHRPMLQFITT